MVHTSQLYILLRSLYVLRTDHPYQLRLRRTLRYLLHPSGGLSLSAHCLISCSHLLTFQGNNFYTAYAAAGNGRVAEYELAFFILPIQETRLISPSLRGLRCRNVQLLADLPSAYEFLQESCCLPG